MSEKDNSRNPIGDVYAERGATALEYALFGALIAAVIDLGVQQLGSNACSAFSKIGSTIAAH